jgi:hypothetical protein
MDDSESPAVGAGSALLDLQAIAKRSGDPALCSAVRRVAWQMAHTADRCAGAQASAQSLSARLDVIIAQRDEAVTALRTSGLPARLKRQADELARVMAHMKDLVAERDEARRAWDNLRAEVAKLKAALKAKPAAPPEPPKSSKSKQPAIFDTIPPVEPSAEESAMMAERAVVVAEAERLTALGKRRSADEHARLIALQAKLAEFAPRVKAFKAIRHAKLMALQAEALAAEARKTAGLATP